MFLLQCVSPVPVSLSLKDVSVDVFRRPEYGELRLNSSGNSPGVRISHMTYYDISEERLRYVHTSTSTAEQDSFVLVFSYRGARLHENFYVKIRHANRLREVANKGALVPQGRTVTIDATQLRFARPRVNARQIFYLIRKPPVHGSLLIREEGKQLRPNRFRQWDVDRRKLIYRHDGGNEPDDSFLFDVTDGDEDLKGNKFSFRIRTVTLELFVSSGRDLKVGG